MLRLPVPPLARNLTTRLKHFPLHDTCVTSVLTHLLEQQRIPAIAILVGHLQLQANVPILNCPGVLPLDDHP